MGQSGLKVRTALSNMMFYKSAKHRRLKIEVYYDDGLLRRQGKLDRYYPKQRQGKVDYIGRR